LAARPTFQLGALWDDNGTAQNLIVNELKNFTSTHFHRDVEATQGVYSFTVFDQRMTFAQSNNLNATVHTLVYRNSTSPNWLGWVDGDASCNSYTEAQLRTILEDFINAVLTHYPTTVTVVDVVNEPITTPALNNCWREIIGYPDYVIAAFEFARLYRKAGTLLRINEFFGTANGSTTTINDLFSLIDALIAAGAPPDIIGVQNHLQADTIGSTGDLYLTQFDLLLAGAQARGLQVQISEMDINEGSHTLAEQGVMFGDMFARCFLHASCTGFSTWGVYDGNTWLSGSFPGVEPLLWDASFQPKPAYTFIRDFLLSQGAPGMTIQGVTIRGGSFP